MILFVIIFIACIVGGFCGMPILFIFPVVSVIAIIFAIINPNKNDYNLKEEHKSDIKDNDVQDLSFFDMINKK